MQLVPLSPSLSLSHLVSHTPSSPALLTQLIPLPAHLRLIVIGSTHRLGCVIVLGLSAFSIPWLIASAVVTYVRVCSLSLSLTPSSLVLPLANAFEIYRFQ